MFLEYKNEIVIIDVGLQFPEDETPGIDYIIPNVEYLEKKKQNVAGIILTHGHYDHIGALPHLLAKLGNPPIYATSITKAIIEKRQDDFPNAPKMNIQVVKNGSEIKISNIMNSLTANSESDTEMKWTGDAINIIEVAYGIWLTGQLNNGNATLTQIVKWLETNLKVTIGNIQSRFAEISSRKRLSPTKFLDQMKDAILKRIDNNNS